MLTTASKAESQQGICKGIGACRALVAEVLGKYSVRGAYYEAGTVGTTEEEHEECGCGAAHTDELQGDPTVQPAGIKLRWLTLPREIGHP